MRIDRLRATSFAIAFASSASVASDARAQDVAAVRSDVATQALERRMEGLAALRERWRAFGELFASRQMIEAREMLLSPPPDPELARGAYGEDDLAKS